MCGRARCTLRPQDLPTTCGFHGPLKDVNSERFHPSYNMPPGSYMPVIRCNREESSNEPLVHYMKWGLVPSFTKKSERPDFFRMFNARSESVQEKASFRRLLPYGRCLAIVEGFYEWKKDGSKKQPFYVHFKDGRPLVFAALFDCWTNKEGETLFTFTILTTRASKALEWLHDRMPVILGNKEEMHSWLRGEFAAISLKHLTQPYEAQDLVWYPVTPAMGKISFDGPDCIKQITTGDEKKNLLSGLFSKQKVPSLPQNKAKEEDDVPHGSLMDKVELKALVAAMEPDEEISEKATHADTRGEEETHMKNNTKEETFSEVSSVATFEDIKIPDMKAGFKRKEHPTDEKHAGVLTSGKQQRTLLNFFGKQ